MDVRMGVGLDDLVGHPKELKTLSAALLVKRLARVCLILNGLKRGSQNRFRAWCWRPMVLRI
jgi:hypothetical protein